MNGEEFVGILVEFGVNISPATRNQWRAKGSISPTILRNALAHVRSTVLGEAIRPIVEFHCLDFDHGSSVDSFAKRINKPSIVKQLRETVGGIYCFYDASGKIIYIGKTEKSNLLTEMEQRYWGKKVRVRLLVRGKAAAPMHRIADLAQYMSAYHVDGRLIGDVEALLTRVVLNNAANVRVESFSPKTRKGGR